MIPLILGMNYLHKKEIVHCDIKPGNICLNFKQSYKINKSTRTIWKKNKFIDFGSSFTKDSIISLLNTGGGLLKTNLQLKGTQGFVLYQFAINTSLLRCINSEINDTNTNTIADYILNICKINDIHALMITFLSSFDSNIYIKPFNENFDTFL